MFPCAVVNCRSASLRPVVLCARGVLSAAYRGALIALFAGVQASFIEVSVDPTPHAWYLLFALGFLFFFSRYLAGHRARDLYLAAGLLALAVATLEFSLELIFAIPVALAILWFTRRELLPERSVAVKTTLKACAVFLATTFVIWPAVDPRRISGELRHPGCIGAAEKPWFSTHSALCHPRFQQRSQRACLGLGSRGLGLAAALWLLFGSGSLFPRLSLPLAPRSPSASELQITSF